MLLLFSHIFNKKNQLDITFFLEFWKTGTKFFDSLTLKNFEEKGFTDKAKITLLKLLLLKLKKKILMFPHHYTTYL